MRYTTTVSIAAALACAATAFGQGRLIGIESNRNIYEIDMATGAKVQIGQATSNAGTTGGLALDPHTGTVYLTSTSLDSLFTLDIATGEATLVGAYGDPALVMHGLEFDSGANILYGASNDGDLYTIDTTTGVATLVGLSGLSSFTNLGYNSDTGIMYATNSGTDSSYIMDTSTGFTTLLGPLNGATNPNGLAYNSDTGVMYIVCNSTDTLYTLDTTTGAGIPVGSTGSGNLLGLVYISEGGPGCYPNCDGSTVEPILNVDDFTCFINEFAAAQTLPHEQQITSYPNCDESTIAPVLNVDDFTCFINAFAQGCR